MLTTSTGRALIKGWEQLSLFVYQDAGGLDTIGWGHLVKAGESFPGPITESEADKLFKDDLRMFEDVVSRSVTLPEILPLEFDAMVSLAYNIGGNNFKRSSVLAKVNANLREEVPKHFADWRKAGGKVLRGLVRRRTLEAQLFVDADRGEGWGFGFVEKYFG